VFLLIWLKLIFSLSLPAGNRAKGHDTSERFWEPVQYAYGATTYSIQTRYAKYGEPAISHGQRKQPHFVLMPCLFCRVEGGTVSAGQTRYRGRLIMLDEYFVSSSTLHRNERVKLAAMFWNIVGAGMFIGGVAGAFFYEGPLFWGKVGIAVVGIVLALIFQRVG